MTEEQDQAPIRINPKLLRFVQVVLVVITGFLLVAHVLKWSILQVDSITLALIGFLLVIPLVDLERTMGSHLNY